MRGRLLLFSSCVATAGVLAAGAAGGGAKPVIGRPAASPTRARAGQRFAVSFHVSHAQSVKFAVALGSAPLRHTDSFHAGLARTTVLLPGSASGSLHVTLTAKSPAGTSTRKAAFAVQAVPPPELSIADASAPEGNSGTTPLAFQVTLSHASTKPVSVSYATGDGLAKAPSDYTAANGTLTFAPGDTTKTITVQVVGDTAIETDEDFTVTLSNAVNATLAGDSATGRIMNDDTLAVGSYKGATAEGNSVFFTVTSGGTITQFRTNSLTEDCGGGASLEGSIDWGSTSFKIASDGTFLGKGTWSGSETYGNITYTAESWSVSGTFTTPTAVSGSITLSDDLTYNGNPYHCAGTIAYTAAFQG